MNQKKYWLRGGVTLGGLYFLVTIVYLIIGYFTEGPGNFSWASIPLVLFGHPTTSLLKDILGVSPFPLEIHQGSLFYPFSVLIIAGTVQYFLVGLLLGWFYGKNRGSDQFISNDLESKVIQKRYWLRGGILASALALIGVISPLSIYIPIFLPMNVFTSLSESLLSFMPMWIVVIVLKAVVVMLYFMIGATVGWIYGKIKNKFVNNS